MADVEVTELLHVMRRIVCVLCVSLGCALSVAQAAPPDVAPGSQDYLKRSRDGWFFYQEPPAPAEEEEDEEDSRPLPESFKQLPEKIWSEPEKYKDTLKSLPINGVDLSKLPSVFLRELVTAKKEAAMDTPTVETVKTYIVVQQAAYDRASQFTDSYQLAMYVNPELNYESKHPSSEFGHRLEAHIKQQDEDHTLMQASQYAGLFFFFTSTCPYCLDQSKIMKLFQDQYGMSVFPVSIDGTGLPEYPRPHVDNGMVERLGVHMTPMVYLAIPEEKFLTPIGAGIMTLSDLRERVLVILKRRDMLKPQQG